MKLIKQDLAAPAFSSVLFFVTWVEFVSHHLIGIDVVGNMLFYPLRSWQLENRKVLLLGVACGLNCQLPSLSVVHLARTRIL